LRRHASGLPHEYPAVAARSRADAVRAVLATKLVAPPGAATNYSSDGYVLLAAIVELASKQPFARYVTRHLLEPAGMHDTQYAGACTHAFARRVAAGEQSAPCQLPAILARRGPTGVITTMDDMNRWVDAVVRRKLFGEQATIGWEEMGSLIGHGGDDDAVGHSAAMFHDRARDRTLIVATNAGEFAGQPFASIVAHRLMAILQGDVPRTVTLA
jgi:CubicO group peptidase (beta-lactamase class C family)